MALSPEVIDFINAGGTLEEYLGRMYQEQTAQEQPTYSTPDFTLNDLKSPQWYHTVSENPVALHYNINGVGHTFIPEGYISKGLRKDDTQWYNNNFLKEGTLDAIFKQGALVDLEGLAPNWAVNSLEKSGFDTKGVLVPNNTLKDVGILQDNGLLTSQKTYKIDKKDRTKGELLGLTELDGRYVYLKQPQGSRAGLTYADETGRTEAEYTKVRGGWLGEQVVNLAEGFAEVPLLPEVIGSITGSPALYASLKGLQTAGSGGDLKDVFESGVKAYVSAGGLKGTSNLSTEAVTAIETMTAVAGENDPLQAFIKQYGADELGNALEDTDFANYAKSSITDVVGVDTVNFLEDNLDYVKAGKEILIEGKDPSEVLVDRFGNQIVSGLGAESPTERALAFAGLKTGVALDQGLSANDALLAGAEEYITRGGGLPDFNEIASSVGIKDFDVNIPDLGLDIPELEGLGLNIREIADLGIDVSGLGLEGLEMRGLTLPEIQGFGVDISGLTFPELQARGYELANIGELGFSIPEMDLSGLSPRDLGYDVGSWGELQDLGVDIGSLDLSEYNLGQLADLNLDLQLPELDLALKKYGQQPSELASLEMDKELTGEEDVFGEFDQPEITRISRRLLGDIA